jgi:hypothetical protein
MDQVDQQPGDGGHPDDGAGEVEELGHGPERDPSPATGRLRGRWLALGPGARSTVAAVLGVALGAAVVLGFQNVHGHRPVPRPTTATSLPVSATLLAEDVCTSYDGSVLQVSFRIVNAGQHPVTVVGVRPDLPLGMLLSMGTTLDSGDCAPGGPGPADGTLRPGQSQPVTFRLLPLDSCPQPAPVAASVDVTGAGPPTVSVPVLVDLGSVQFVGCATASAAP